MAWQDQVVVVTGGASGIGKAAAKRFAGCGAAVAINDLNADAAAEVAQAIQRTGGRAIAIAGDISDEATVGKNADRVVREFGGIDVLISNAGLSNQGRAESYVGWERSIGVNLHGHYYWARAAAERSMIPNRRGAIVFTASGAALAGLLNDVGYVASKHAIVGLTKALALEWAGYGIRVNAVAPGVIDTEMLARWKESPAYETRVARVPLGRLGRVDEIVGAMIYLASDEAAYTTGVTLPVDGGQSALHSGMPARRAD